MASTKRERQRANRELKRAEETAVAKRANLISRGKRVAIWVGLLIVVLIIANFVFGGGEEAAAAAILNRQPA